MTVINITTGEIREGLTAEKLFEWIAENPDCKFSRLLTGDTVEIASTH